ncbi:type VI secretion system baseplate subunit TssK [Alkalilimnicola sp. S0819]|uniref:type VI secretion system baseplate subunit TssK n=1 Tax=Alkalilimnicola sp. S0819 TaxID=2613922 RepID=UPI001261E46E|nr:type VI secretion system baseplate subunit TssK [Alkalilimnicola sp. S0819]KAB7622618.1 type VI secretion system baseplate subunit TssK [Alkalilimnicola sp. S0819]MPQ17389.1 type VI secretion system baseplate subunit TssK [Alkalilimnicola sp. S0819]
MLNNKIAWLESQYLFPHHFQQQERYIEHRIEQRAGAIRAEVYGLRRLGIDSGALAEGRFALRQASGLMPDGTPFEMPAEDPLPPPLRVPEHTRERTVYLAMPVYQAGNGWLAREETAQGIARYRLGLLDVYDYSGETREPEAVETAVLSPRLLLEGEDLGGYTLLPLARIRELTPEGAVVLERRFIPPCLDIACSQRLRLWLEELIGLLRQRGEALAARFAQPGKSGGSSAIADFLLLQLINRAEPRLRHLQQRPLLHPEVLYRELTGLSGELATFTTAAKRPLAQAAYRHQALEASFAPLIEQLGRQLSAVLEQTAVALPLEERQYGLRVAPLADRGLLKQARFVLAARADLATEQLREQLGPLIKAGAVENIRELVNNQLPGITLNPLPVVPREIPYHAGFVYFELDSRCEPWQALRQSGGFAFHIAGEFPGLELEFWAIRA